MSINPIHFEFARPQKWEISSLPSLHGKTAIVTGANSSDSLGWHVAHQLALKGAKVFVGARSLEKAESGIKAMLTESSDTINPDNLIPLVMDLSDLKAVQKVSQEFIVKEERLDILVNNAAVLAIPYELDSNGISTSFATNHLGPFVFTTTLLPLLIKTAQINPDVRIINVSSTALFDVPSTAKFSSLEDFNETFPSDAGVKASDYLRYGYSKLANHLFTLELQRHLLAPINSTSSASSSILVMSVHPGGVATAGSAKFLGSKEHELFKKGFSPLEGALTPLFAASHAEPREEVEKYRGAFLLPWGGVKETSAQALTEDERIQKELWKASESVVASVLGN